MYLLNTLFVLINLTWPLFVKNVQRFFNYEKEEDKPTIQDMFIFISI